PRLPAGCANLASFLASFANFAKNVGHATQTLGDPRMTATHMGARLRRLREEHGLTQAAFATSLGLSASYLNQLEKDARPITSRVPTTLSEVYGVDSTFFASDADTRLIAELTEALADPQVSAGIPASAVVDL